MGRKVDVLSKVEGRQKTHKLRGETVSKIIQMDVEVAGDDEFVRYGFSDGKE